jgi:hypothetical protein
MLSHLSRSDFENAIQAHGGDRGVRTLSTWDLFKGMAYGQLSSSFSVREIGASMAANSSRLYHAGLKPIRRSTFCDAMEKRNHHIFQTVFHTTVEQAQLLAGKHNKRFKNPLKIVDASLIELCLPKYDWATFRRAKGAVKLHVRLDGDTHLPEEAHISAGTVHDVHGMDWLCQESGVTYVFDRGYIDYKRLYHIELAQSFFVTRMKSNAKYQVKRVLPHDKDGNILSDNIIQLCGYKARQQYPALLRKIRYHDENYNRTYSFITNNLEASAQEIADIYKERWQIELFFKWLKQNLKVKTFWGTSQNAVFMQIWVALILSVLLWMVKTLEGITASSHLILQMVKTTLLSRNSIMGLCTNIAPPPEIPSLQLSFEGLL